MRNDDKLKVRQTESKRKAFKELTVIRDTIFWIDVAQSSDAFGTSLHHSGCAHH